jgi:L-alanine-DL-glutamate epimerase-like enolase superfamily enzyme
LLADVRLVGEQLLVYVEKGGFRAVKMRVGVMDGEPHRSAARVRAARRALGPDVKLMADAHGTWTVSEAKAFCRMVEDQDLYWLEEPVTADDKAGLAEVRRASAVPISTGESEFTRHDFREIAELRAADVLQPDLAIAGGITEGVRIGAVASAFNLRLAPHLWSGAPAFAAGVALAASQSAGFILEYSLGANPLLHELVHEKFVVVDGQLEIPDRPGLGITVDEDFVRHYARE